MQTWQECRDCCAKRAEMRWKEETLLCEFPTALR
jgi:hypothetical protein